VAVSIGDSTARCRRNSVGERTPCTILPVRTGLVAVVMVGLVSLAGCSTTASNRSAHATTTTARASTTTGGATTATTAAPTSNLVVTATVRSQLLAAGAALNSLPTSAYSALRPGETYYAYDAATQTYWAGAGLVPSSSSTRAQVSVQDDGAYLLFTRPSGGAWKGYDVGLAGTPDADPCPIMVPVAVLQLWNWAPGTCRPAAIS